MRRKEKVMEKKKEKGLPMPNQMSVDYMHRSRSRVLGYCHLVTIPYHQASGCSINATNGGLF
jgi:hypothetical protein